MSELISLDKIDILLPNIAIKLVERQDLMKCLQYNDDDALSKEITPEQINKLMDIKHKSQVRIFYKPFNDFILNQERTELRVYFLRFRPNNRYLTNVNIAFDIVVHNDLWELEGGKQRPLVMYREILNALNGTFIGGIGQLVFENSNCDLRYFNKNFAGYTFTMQTRLN